MQYLMIVILLISISCNAEDSRAYFTGGEKFNVTWNQFYNLVDHEPEIDDPLIEQGETMVPAIVEAIQHKDMQRRRYAIGALGYIKSRVALEQLEKILNDVTEFDYFKGDALQAIYQIDKVLGKKYAEQFKGNGKYLTNISEAVLKDEPWLIKPTEEGE